MRFLLLLPFVLSFAAYAEDSFHAQPSGSFTSGGLTFGLLIQGPGVIATSGDVKPEAGWPKQDGATWETRGAITTPEGAVVKVSEKLTARGDGVDVELRLESEKPLAIDTAAVVVELPAGEFAGKGLSYNSGEAVGLPKEPGEGMVADHWKSGISSIGIPTGDHRVVVSGELDSGVADERVWGQPRFGLRIFSHRPDGKVLTLGTLKFGVSTAKL